MVDVSEIILWAALNLQRLCHIVRPLNEWFQPLPAVQPFAAFADVMRLLQLAHHAFHARILIRHNNHALECLRQIQGEKM